MQESRLCDHDPNKTHKKVVIKKNYFPKNSSNFHKNSKSEKNSRFFGKKPQQKTSKTQATGGLEHGKGYVQK